MRCAGLALGAVALRAAADSIPSPGPEHYAALRDGFMWGTATASYQVEGAIKEDGRGPTIWDTFTHLNGTIKHNDNGDTADDQYHRYAEDMRLLANMGMGWYRFSIAWSRIMPTGELPVSQKGIDHYNDLIDEALANGVRPLVTLYHWDLPQALETKYGGWLSEEIPAKFEAYARVCFEAFGDRVKWWLTFNEPLSFTRLGYSLGIHAPARCSDRSRCVAGNSDWEPYKVAHNVILSHGAAMDLYRREFEPSQQGQVGITLNGDWGEPLTQDPLDYEASDRFVEFQMSWFADPAFFGDYPASMKRYAAARLPVFTPEQSAMLKRNKPKFFGFNHYTSQYVTHFTPEELAARTGAGWDYDVTMKFSFSDKNGKLIGIPGAPAWLYDCPWGFRKLLKWLYARYETPIVVTENGFAVPGEFSDPLPAVLLDLPRIHYYSGYIAAMNDAVRAGEADVLGHFAWSLEDNFEWHDGYSIRFGLHYIDYKNNLTRHVKASAQWFTELTALYANRAPILGGPTEENGGVSQALVKTENQNSTNQNRKGCGGAGAAALALVAVSVGAVALIWRETRRNLRADGEEVNGSSSGEHDENGSPVRQNNKTTSRNGYDMVPSGSGGVLFGSGEFRGIP